MSNPSDDALKLIQSKPEGVLQSELWKILDVDSRKCSRIVKKLLDSGTIERAEFRKDGIKTFVLIARRRPVEPSHILAGGVKKLLDSGTIERAEFRKDGIKTFVLIARRRPVEPSHILAGGELIPCIACDEECNVEQCHRLLDWIYQLAICEAGE